MAGRESSNGQEGTEKYFLLKPDVQNEGTGVEETKASTTGPQSAIKDFSETSSAIDLDNNASEEKDNRRTTDFSEGVEESQDEGPSARKLRTASDVEHERDIAEQKRNRRAWAQPGAKRGGRRDIKKSGWGRFLGKKQTPFEAGDLVEAEWRGTGWWYVGYVQGEATAGGKGSESGTSSSARSIARKRHVYHVVFADGDEADVKGNDLKPLGPRGEHGNATGSSDDTLPRHVPVVDLGSGRLFLNLKPPSAAEDESLEDLDQRLRRGEQAVSGGRETQSGPSEGDGGRGVVDAPAGGTDWGETGSTRFTFQPRLAADKVSVLSFASSSAARGKKGGRRLHGANNGTARQVEEPRKKSGHGDGDGDVGRRADSWREEGGELARIVQVPESNENHGQRIFFVV